MGPLELMGGGEHGCMTEAGVGEQTCLLQWYPSGVDLMDVTARC